MIKITHNNLPEGVNEILDKIIEIKHMLLKKSNEHQPENDQLLTISQAGELINLSVPTIYGYVSRNEIPFSKKGKRLYFSKQELIAWIKEGRRKTVAEIADEADQYLGKKKGGKS